MKCKEFERDIYLYAELSEEERKQVDLHIRECAECKDLFQLVSAVNTWITKAALVKPEIVNHGKLTSSIMQAVAAQKQSQLWVNNPFFRYAMVAASLVLIIGFGVEQLLPAEALSKQVPGSKTVTLNSASLMKVVINKRQNPESRTSLYAYAKSGDCDNTLIEKFKKKSF